jgi:hypothetical protein
MGEKFRGLENLGTDGALAFAAAMVYSLHPIHTQAVNYTFARSEILSVFFVLAAIFVHVKNHEARYTIGRAIGVATLLLLAIRSKERALMLIPVLFLFDLFVRSKDGWPVRRQRWLKLAVPIVAVGALGSINLYLGFQAQHEGAIGAGRYVPELLPYFLTQFVVRLHYLKLHFLPVDLSFDCAFSLRESLADPILVLAIFLHLLLLALALSSRGESGLIGFGVFRFFLFLLPTSGLVPTHWFMHEHWTYIPSFGILLTLLGLIQWLTARTGWRPIPAVGKPLIALGFVLLCALLALLVVDRNKVWQSELSLWADAQENAATHPWVWNHLGVAYVERGEFDLAIEHLERAESISGPTAALHQSIGLCLLQKGDLEGALSRLTRAKQRDSDRPRIQVT